MFVVVTAGLYVCFYSLQNIHIAKCLSDVFIIIETSNTAIYDKQADSGM